MKPRGERSLFPAVFRRPSVRRNLWSALVVASAVTAACLALYFVVLVVWSLWFRQPILMMPELEPKDLATAQMALAQSFTNFAGIFLTAFLGVFAIQEIVVSLEERNARPDVRIGFRVNQERVIDTFSIGTKSESFTMRLAICNDGAAPASRYRIELRLPCLRQLVLDMRAGRADSRSIQAAVSPLLGEWWREWSYGNTDQDDVMLYFTSEGAITIPPNWPVNLCNITIPTASLDSGHYTNFYSVFTPGGEQNGQIFVYFDKDWTEDDDFGSRALRFHKQR